MSYPNFPAPHPRSRVRTALSAVAVVAAALLAPLAAPDTALADQPANQLISGALDGGPANGDADRPQMAHDGRYVVFDSMATNISRDPVRRTVRNIFRRDLVTGETRVVSIGMGGVASDAWNSFSWASADGRFVVFVSDASNLVPGGIGRRSIYLRDMVAGTTEVVSVNSAGQRANLASSRPMISPNGRFVMFNSQATNLSPLANGFEQVYIRDRQSATTTLVSIAASGKAAGNGVSYRGMASDDGRYVAFSARASNIVADDTNAAEDVFLRDMQSGITTRVDLTPSGGQVAGAARPYLSPDARWLTYNSHGVGIDPADTSTNSDVFLYDVVNRTTRRVSVALGGGIAAGDALRGFVTDDGRYVYFNSFAGNLVANDTNGAGDCFVRDMVTGVTTRISVSWYGGNADAQTFRPVPSSDGSVVVYKGMARNVVQGDRSTGWQIYTTRPGALAPGGDVTPPQMTVTTPTQGSASPNHGVKLSGAASDDVAVDAVQVRLKNTGTGQFLQPDGSWGVTSMPLNAALASRWAPSTPWSLVANLPDGTYGFSTTVLDSSRNATAGPYRNFRVAAVPDSVPPTVSVTSPATGTTVPTRVVGFAGHADDTGGAGAGLSRVLLSLRDTRTGQWLHADGSWGAVDRIPVTLADQATASTDWSYEHPLADGSYEVQVVAVDDSGNESTASNAIPFVVDGPDPDTTPPTATLDAPAAGSQSATSRVLLRGTANDAAGDLAGIRAVQVRVRDTATGEYLQDDGDFDKIATRLSADVATPGALTTAWNYEAGLPNGTYLITWFSLDLSGNESAPQAGRQISVDNTDRTTPTVSVAAPQPGSTAYGRTTTISGSAADSGGELAGVDKVFVTLRNTATGKYLQPTGTWSTTPRRLDASLTDSAASTTSWSFSASLSAGSYEAALVSADISRNESAATVVPFSVSLADTAAPSGAVTRPSAGATVTDNSVTISGNAADTGGDAAGVAGVVLTVQDVGSSQWLQPDGTYGAAAAQLPTTLAQPGAAATTWTTTLAMPNRSYAVSATITDASGNTSTLPSVTFTVDAPNVDSVAPTANVDSPSGAFYTPTVQVTGTAADTGGQRAGVGRVSVGVRTSSGAWLQPDGSFGAAPQRLPAELSAPGSTATGWTLRRDLPDGSYTVSAVSIDVSGNPGDVTTDTNVTVDTSDTVKPTISVTAPTSGATVTGPNVTLTGTAADSGGYRAGVDKVFVTLKNRSSGQWLRADGTWGATAVRLAAVLDARGAGSTGWTFSTALSPGQYSFTSIVLDASRNENDPKPTTLFTVAP